MTLCASGHEVQMTIMLRGDDAAAAMEHLSSLAHGKPVSVYIDDLVARPRAEGGAIDVDVYGHLGVERASACDRCGVTLASAHTYHRSDCPHWRP